MSIGEADLDNLQQQINNLQSQINAQGQEIAQFETYVSSGGMRASRTTCHVSTRIYR
jgi:DNA-binding protein YbaB